MRRFLALFLTKPALRTQALLLAALSMPVLGVAQTMSQSVAPVRPSKAEEKMEPTTVQAEQMTGRPDREIYLDRDAEIVRGQTKLNSDKAVYYQEQNEVEAEGNVRVVRFGDKYAGDKLRLNLDTGQGWMLNPKYKLIRNNAQGKGDRVDFETKERATMTAGTYSTCEGPHPDWYVAADSLTLDSAQDSGDASKAIVYFKDVPILGAPMISFPLSDGRKSGLLPPTIGTTSSGGLEVMQPYYFNLAPNRDFTLYPKYISKRGVQLGADARYLDENYFGETKFEFLPNDQQIGNNRYAISSLHTQKLAPGLTFGWNYNQVSDDRYFTDFTTHFEGMADALSGLSNASTTLSAQRLLSREVNLDYAGKNWSTNARFTNYQLLQDDANPMVRPYERLPQLSVKTWGSSGRGEAYWTVDAELTRFWLSDADLAAHHALANAVQKGEFGDRGDRLVLKPQISYSLLQPGYFITPKLSLHMTSYQLDNQFDSSRPSSLNRVLPTFSIDSGLVYERDTTLFGHKLTQTLEPRLFYVYTPYRDQSQFPNFDSAEPGFGFAQMFSENRFVGSDRIADANQITAAIISRYLEPSGAERMRFAIGQRYYLQDQRVQLESTTNDSRSDLLLAAGGQLSKTLSIDTALQYSETQRQVNNGNISINWKPGYKKALSASYRYLRDKTGDYVGINQVNVSGQWPLTNRWDAVGLVSYSLPDNKVIQSLIGMEYNADCWVFRLGAQRLYTATDSTGSSFFIQLQLNGLSKIGTGGLDTFRKSIPGYQYLPDSNAVLAK